MSATNLEKAEAVVEAAAADPALAPIAEEMDRTGKVDPAYRKGVRAQEVARRSPDCAGSVRRGSRRRRRTDLRESRGFEPTDVRQAKTSSTKPGLARRLRRVPSPAKGGDCQARHSSHGCDSGALVPLLPYLAWPANVRSMRPQSTDPRDVAREAAHRDNPAGQGEPRRRRRGRRELLRLRSGGIVRDIHRRPQPNDHDSLRRPARHEAGRNDAERSLAAASLFRAVLEHLTRSDWRKMR
jgi:hypothetical protein